MRFPRYDSGPTKVLERQVKVADHTYKGQSKAVRTTTRTHTGPRKALRV